MALSVRTMMAAAAMAALAACGDDPEPAPVAPPPPPPAPVVQQVARVTAVEIGVARTGLILSAQGLVPGDGWRAARLQPRGAGADGALEFDMVAEPPASIDPVLTQRLRADLAIDRDALRAAGGVRVFGAEGPASAATPPAP